MSRRLLRYGAIFLALSALLFAGKEFPSNPGETTKTNEYIVRLQDGADSSQVLAGLQATPLVHGNLYHLTNAPATLPSRLAGGSQVDFVEPNRVRHGTI